MSLRQWLGIETPPAAPTVPASSSTQEVGDYRIVERKDGRFNVVGSRGSLTTRKTKEAAEQVALEYTLYGLPAKEAPASTPSRSSARAGQRATGPPKPPHPGGRPRGDSKRKEPEAVQPETALQVFWDAHPAAKRTKLGQLSAATASITAQLRSEHAELQKKTTKPACC